MESLKRELFKLVLLTIVFIGVPIISISCVNASAKEKKETAISVEKGTRTVSQEAKDYWFAGKAELSSFKLTQARYGELHEGTAVLVYVTEPFSKTSNTKADYDNENNISVLKLNKTKKFTTGIYPYSMMTSTFFPFENTSTSLKIASSLQEWCGMTYAEMKNEDELIFNLDSYFEGFTFKNMRVKKDILEDDLWTLIRLNPELLPLGEQQIIPSMFFLRLRNQKNIQAHKAIASLENKNDISYYILKYPKFNRTLTIQFSKTFPHKILGWEDSHYSGYGTDKKLLTTKAELLNTVRTDYWNQNKNEHKEWRSKLGL